VKCTTLDSRKLRGQGETHAKVIFPVSDENPFGLSPFDEHIDEYLTAVRDAPAAAVEHRTAAPTKHLPVWSDAKAGVWLYQGNCLTIMDQIAARYPDGVFDMIFADPPYFLSNGGITCHAGRMVSVNKGAWDRSMGPDENHNFNREWLARCQRVLKPNGTIWVSGTTHVIHSIGFAMQQLGFKVLNDITWVKPNPPPNLSCRYFTHATETIIWAAKNEHSKHHFDYQLMRKLAGGKQMKSVWEILPPGTDEKLHGKHPTQKPVALLRRILLASTKPGDTVLDPFVGSGTTVVAALAEGRRAVGIELEQVYVNLAIVRIEDGLRGGPQQKLDLHYAGSRQGASEGN
jgi:site-specific DNA-methyltransferase (adenine-specific)